MKALLTLAVVLLLCIIASPGMAGKGGGLEIASKGPLPTQAGVVTWADKYYSKYEPKLKGDDKETIDSIKAAFFMNKGVQYFMDDTISKLVTELTISLTGKKSFEVMVTASALLVKTDPKNARVINLFGAVLNAASKDAEALPVFEYGVSIRPKNPLLRLNLANAYLDANQDEKAKKILDKLCFENSEDKAVWRALATYWYKKKNMPMFRDCLFKAAKFKGLARKKADKKDKKVKDNAAQDNESPEQLEPKLKELATCEPFTSADIMEDDYPAEAQEIRDKYCKIQGDEKWRLPKLPMCNLSTPKEYEQNKSILEEWVKVFIVKHAEWSRQKAMMVGVDPNASEKAVEAQARKAAKAQVAEAMKNAQDMLKYMKNLPAMQGVNNKNKINDAMKKLAKAAKGQGVNLPKDKPKSSEDDEGSEEESVDMSKIPGFDSGSPWAQINYRNYSEVERTYSIYFFKYYKEYNAQVKDIYKVYAEKVKGEHERFDPEWEKLQEEHSKHTVDHGDKDIPCRRAMLEHKQRLNEISLNYYHRWLNLYMPDYAQRMKPNLDAYWDVCMIYVRSMTDPKVMEREFLRVKTNYLLYASMAGTAIGAGGFDYYPETDEEQQQLDVDIALAKEEAEQKKPEFARDFQSPEFDFHKWMEDHFVLEIAGQFFALKANVGFNICGVGAELKGKTELYKRTATWDLDNNTYRETDGATGEGKLKIGPITAGSKFEIDSQLNAKTSTKITAGDFSVQDQEKFPNK